MWFCKNPLCLDVFVWFAKGDTTLILMKIQNGMMSKKSSKWQKKIQNDNKKISVKYCMPFILNVSWISLYFVGDAYRNNLRFLVFDWVVILCMNNLNKKTRFYALFCKIIKPIDMTGLKKLLINRNKWSYT